MFGNIKEMMKQVQNAQANFKEAQKELAKVKVIGESGAGVVKVVMNGLGDVLDIDVEDSIFNEEKQIVLDLIKAACNDANSKRDKMKSDKMSSMLSKMGLPEGFKFPFSNDGEEK